MALKNILRARLGKYLFLALSLLRRTIPMPDALRLRCKEFVFTHFGTFFQDYSVYQLWREQKNAALSLSKFPGPAAPTKHDWDRLITRNKSMATHDVIIPVYKGYSETMRAIYSVLEWRQETLFELMVIDDASPDIMLKQELQHLSERGFFTLLVNQENLGFVGTVNRGMQQHKDRDVILLNSDTEVFNNWLDRLVDIAAREKDVGTITPFSNNAEICSYPYANKDNPFALECDFAALDMKAASVNADRLVTIPTAVGFCMYIKRACLEQTGYFDQEAFGKGYGEENDFCLKANLYGWRHVLATNVFVLHYGGTSFSTSKNAATRRAMSVIRKRYPTYEKVVADFIAKNPTRNARAMLDIERIKRPEYTRYFLFVTHHLGGGTDKHIADMARYLHQNQTGVAVLKPHPIHHGRIVLENPYTSPTPNLELDPALYEDRLFLIELLKTLGVSRLHVQHIIGFTDAIVPLITFVKEALSIPADITLHDYSPLCSHVHQFDHSELYFGTKHPHYCEACLKKYGAPAACQETQAWRSMWKILIDASEHVFVPSAHLEHAMKPYFPHPNYLVRPHPEPQILKGFVPARWKIDDPITLGIIGAIGEHKGARLLLALAKDAEKRKLPIRFKIIGYSSLDHEFAGISTISITGKFSDATLPKYLEQTGVNAIFLPSICPESFSFVLSISYFGGFFPIVFDIGAQAERVKEAGFGEVIPATLMQDIAALNDRLCALRFKYPSPYSMKTGEELYPNFLKDYYGI